METSRKPTGGAVLILHQNEGVPRSRLNPHGHGVHQDMRAKSHADELRSDDHASTAAISPGLHAAPEEKPSPAMKLVKADLHDLNATEMVAKGGHVVEQMTGNANFTTPVPALAAVTTAIDALSVASAEAEGGAHAAIDARDLALVTLRDLLTALCAYVNFTSGTDLAKAITSGFEPVRTPSPIELEAPVNVRAMYAEGFAGCVELKWRRVAGANIYHVFVGEGDPANAKWTLAGASTRARLRVSELEPGKVFSFYVVALGAAGVGPASEIVSNRAA